MNARTLLLAPLIAVGLMTLNGCRTCRFTEVSARPPCCEGPVPSVSGRIVPVPPGPGDRPVVPPNGPAPVTYLEPAPRRSPSSFDRRESARPPATKEPPLANIPNKESPNKDIPKTDDEPDAQSAIDLPGFAIARAGVASGIQPFPDGVAWLKKKGYKSVLHLSTPGEDTAAARRQFESKGLKYTSLEVSPARLTEEVYKQFVKAVDDRESHPLFVYDKDGSTAGGLWYLYNRAHLKQSDDKARAEAQRLGLRPDEEGEHATMWVAVQALVAKLKP